MTKTREEELKEKLGSIKQIWREIWKKNYKRDDLMAGDISGFTEWFFGEGYKIGIEHGELKGIAEGRQRIIEKANKIFKDDSIYTGRIVKFELRNNKDD